MPRLKVNTWGRIFPPGGKIMILKRNIYPCLDNSSLEFGQIFMFMLRICALLDLKESNVLSYYIKLSKKVHLFRISAIVFTLIELLLCFFHGNKL